MLNSTSMYSRVISTDRAKDRIISVDLAKAKSPENKLPHLSPLPRIILPDNCSFSCQLWHEHYVVYALVDEYGLPTHWDVGGFLGFRPPDNLRPFRHYRLDGRTPERYRYEFVPAKLVTDLIEKMGEIVNKEEFPPAILATLLGEPVLEV